MTNVGYATISIIPSAKGFSRALDREIGPALAASGAKAGRSSGVTAGKGFRGSFLPAIGPGMMTAAGAAGVALGGAIILGVGRGLKTASFLQDAQVGFETMLGSAKAASGMLSDLKAFNLQTPFDLPTLVKGAQGMLGVGTSAKAIIPNLRAIGDAVSATGGGTEQLAGVSRALNQVQAKGRFQAEEMLQISEQGIPIYGLLSKAMGKNVPELLKMAEKGQLLSKDVLPTLYSQMNKDYGGAMAKKSKNLSGVWANFKDSIDVALADGVQPLLPILTKALPVAADVLKGAISGVSTALAGLATFVKPVTDAIGGLFSGGGGGGMMTQLASTGAALKEFGSSLVGPLKAAGQSIMATVKPALDEVGKVIQNVFLPGVRAILPVLKPVFSFIIGVLGNAVGGAIKGVLQILGGLLKAIGGIFSVIGALFRGDWAAVWEGLKNIVTGVIGGIIGAIRVWLNVGILSLFKKGALAILGSFRGLWTGIKGAASAGVNAVKGLFMRGLALIGRVIVGAVKGYFTIWKTLFTTIWRIAVTGWKVLRSAFGGALAAIRTVVSSALKAVGGFFSRTFSSILSTVNSKIASVVSTMKSIPGKILGALRNLGGLLKGKGQDLINGFIQGIRNAASGILGVIKSAITDKIPKFIRDKFDIHSPSRVMAKIGGHVGEGMAVGIERSSKRVTRATAALVSIPDARSGVGSSALSTSGGPLVGSLTLTSTGDTRKDLDEALWTLRRIQRGGLYA